MRPLILFFIKHYAIFLFILLETFSIFLLVQNKSFYRATYFNSSNYMIGNIYQYKSNIVDYFRLKKINGDLALENSMLRERLNLLDSSEIKNRPKDSLYDDFISAKVISNSVYYPNNYMTINKGQKDGIERNMGVICSNGVVGVVKNVSEHFSSVISILHKDMKVSAKIKKNGFFGSLFWTTENPYTALLTEIPKHAVATVGDTVITSGYSSFFPENILIGIIDDIELNEGENFFKIKVNLTTNFQNLNYVYVVKNPLWEERKILEENSKK